MNVLKFGGTSVGSPQRMREVAKLICDNEPKIVVLSAMSGTTNTLVEISNYLYKQNVEAALEVCSKLERNYQKVVNELYISSEYLKKGKELIKEHFDYIKSFTIDLFTVHEEKAILAQGELLSTALFTYHLQEQNINAILLPALNYMRIDKNEEPDNQYIKENIKKELEKYPDCNLFITQGYICRNAFGEIDNLKRGGSDYSASIVGAAVMSREIQIWTDIDGFHNNDPRFVSNTYPLRELSFDEAAELAYFGAKILHPMSVHPAKIANIPVRLKNTMEPQAEGTLISDINQKDGKIKAVAAKDGIIAIKVKSSRMLLAYGFLRKVFETFERYKTSVDMITTSEIAVSVTIDNDSAIEKIVDELKQFGSVEVMKSLSIICIVGDFTAEQKGIAAQVTDALREVPLIMISLGGSENNVSLLVNTSDKIKALNALNNFVFLNR